MQLRLAPTGRGRSTTTGSRGGMWGALAGPLLVAVALGLWGIRRDGSIWRDESVTVQVTHRSLPELLRLLQGVDGVHGAYYLLMHGVFAVLPTDLVTLRLPSVLAYCVTTLVVAAIGRRAWGPLAGGAAGIAYALLPVPQFYAQEGRSYALVSMAVALATYCLVRGAEDGRSRWAIWYAVGLVAAVWLNALAAVVVLPHAIYLFRVAPPTREWRARWLCGVLAAGVACLPLALLIHGQRGSQLNWVPGVTVQAWVTVIVTFVLAVALARWIGPRSWSRPPSVDRLALLIFVVPTAVLLATTLLGLHLYVDRYVAYGQLGLALLIGAAVAVALPRLAALRPWLRLSVIGTVAVVAGALLAPWAVGERTPGSRQDDVLAAQRAIRQLAPRADAVIFVPARRREWVLTDPSVLGPARDVALADSPVHSATLEGTERGADPVQRRMLRARRLLVVLDPFRRTDNMSAADLRKFAVIDHYYRRVQSIRFRGGQVAVCVRRGAG